MCHFTLTVPILIRAGLALSTHVTSHTSSILEKVHSTKAGKQTHLQPRLFKTPPLHILMWLPQITGSH